MMRLLLLILVSLTGLKINASEPCNQPLFGNLEGEISSLLLPIHQLRAKEESSAIRLLQANPILTEIKAPIQFCIANEIFKNDFIGKYHGAINQLEKKYPAAIDSRRDEVCVNTTDIPKDEPALDVLQTRFNQFETVTLEMHVPMPAVESESPPQKSRIYLTLRAAAFGALGAATTQAIRPIMDELSDKGGGQNLELLEGAMIGAIADYLQRISGRTDEGQIAVVNYGSALVAGLIQTKDPNVIGLSIGLTLSQVPSFQKGLEKLADNVPEKLDWRIPLAMVGTFYFLQKKQPQDPIKLSKDKVYGAGTFGTVGYAVAVTQKNETAGFIVANAASLLDEICDHVTKKCQGRFSYSDLMANTIGAAAGAYASRLLPKETLVTYYNKTLSLTYLKKF